MQRGREEVELLLCGFRGVPPPKWPNTCLKPNKMAYTGDFLKTSSHFQDPPKRAPQRGPKKRPQEEAQNSPNSSSQSQGNPCNFDKMSCVGNECLFHVSFLHIRHGLSWDLHFKSPTTTVSLTKCPPGEVGACSMFRSYIYGTGYRARDVMDP